MLGFVSHPGLQKTPNLFFLRRFPNMNVPLPQESQTESLQADCRLSDTAGLSVWHYSGTFFSGNHLTLQKSEAGYG
jgi:hypothetical protein